MIHFSSQQPNEVGSHERGFLAVRFIAGPIFCFTDEEPVALLVLWGRTNGSCCGLKTSTRLQLPTCYTTESLPRAGARAREDYSSHNLLLTAMLAGADMSWSLTASGKPQASHPCPK